MCRFIIAISFFLFSNLLLAYSEGIYPVRNFVISEIGAKSVNALIQDDFGNIIVGTENGLSVFRANRWENYADFSKPVSNLSLDQLGRINIGGPEYFGYFKLDSTGRETFVDFSQYLPDSLSFMNVNQIVPSEAGTFFHLDKRIIKVEENLIDFGYDNVIFVGEFNENIIIQRSNQGLYLYAGNDFRKINGSELFDGKSIIDALDLPGGQLLLLLEKEVIRYDGSNFLPWPIKYENNSGRFRFKAGASTEEWVFLSTAEHGIIQSNHLGEVQNILNNEGGIDFSIGANLYKDNSENIWSITSEGISSITVNTPIKLLDPTPENTNAGQFMFQNENLQLLGLENGLYQYNLNSSYNQGFIDISQLDTGVNSIVDIDGTIFINSEVGFSAFINGRNYPISKGVQSNDILVLPKELYLLEANDKGLGLYKSIYGKWRFQNEIFGINEPISNLLMDEQDQIWALGEESGVMKLDFNEVLYTIAQKTFGLGNNTSLTIYGVFLINGYPIVCTSNGIYEFNELEEQFIQNKAYQTLFGERNQILHLYQDEKENIWFISESEAGLLQVRDNGVEKTVEKIIVPELFPFLNLRVPYIFSPSENDIYFSGKDGFVYLDRLRIKKPKPLEIQMYKLLNFNEDGKLVSEEAFFNKTDFKNKEFHLPNNKFKFILNSNYLNNEELVEYQYSIDNQNWSKWSTDNTLDLSLKPGSYDILIKGKIGEDKISNNTILIPITIQQKWYTKEWAKYIFFGLPILLFGIMLSLVSWLNRRKQLKQVRALDKLRTDIETIKREKEELVEKNRILSSQLISNAKNNDMISQLMQFSNAQENEDIKKGVKKLIKKLKTQPLTPQLEITKSHIVEDPEFITSLKKKFPELTKKDIRLSNYLRLDLTTKEIAPLLGISVRGVEISRYRLRRKLDLRNDIALNDFMKNIKDV